jgi:hypothetical protein
MAERDFDAERKKRPGHKFKLGGKTFRTYPGVPIATVRKPPEQLEGESSVDQVTAFIRQMIVKEDRPSWDKLMTDPEAYIDAEDLLDISKWLSDLIRERMDERSEAVKALTNGTATKKSKATKAIQKPKVKALGKDA